MIFDPHEYLVIGTGPSAVAAIQVLINQGVTPLVIDVGYVSLKNTNPVKNKYKNWFGSSEAYRQFPEDKSLYSERIEARPSYGFGGHSRVWGATCLFDYEHIGWPLSCIPSQADYSLIKKILNPTKFILEESNLYLNFQGLVKKLTEANLKIINPIIAIETSDKSKRKCIKSGSCLTGCDTDSIWFSGNLINEWVTEGLINYENNIYVKTLVQSEGLVKISTISSGNQQDIYAKKVFLATGPLSTARILVESKIVNEVVISETPTTFFAGVSLDKKFSQKENDVTLSKFWISPKEGNNFLIQAYAAGKGNIGRISAFVPKIFNSRKIITILSNYLVPMISYQKEVKAVTVTFSISRGAVVFEDLKDKSYRKDFKNLLRFLKPKFKSQKIFIPSYWLFNSNKVLSGYHFGGSFRHGQLTDDFGQLPNLPNVHIVDSSVLPSIDTGSIVTITMANSARIVRSLFEKPR